MADLSGERFDQLLALTAEVGDPVKDYVILAEGNTSTRIDSGSMWVKASGVRLEHADGPDGFVAVELDPLMRALRGQDQVADADLSAVNTMEDPDRVSPKPHSSAQVDGTALVAELPPASWSMFVLEVS